VLYDCDTSVSCYSDTGTDSTALVGTGSTTFAWLYILCGTGTAVLRGTDSTVFVWFPLGSWCRGGTPNPAGHLRKVFYRMGLNDKVRGAS